MLFYFAYKYDTKYRALQGDHANAHDIIISDKLHRQQLVETTAGVLTNNGHSGSNTSGGLSLHGLERRDWKWAAIDGAIGAFTTALVGANGLYYQACSPAILAAVGVAVPAALPASISACVVSGIALLLIDFATVMVTSEGVKAGWIYNSQSTGVTKRNYIHGDAGYRHLAGNIFTHGHGHHDQYLQSIFEQHAGHVMDNVTVAAPLYSNHTGYYEHFGYVIQHVNGNHLHTAFGELGAEHDMIKTLGQFDGVNYQSGAAAVLHDKVTNTTRLDKRSGGSPWMSYTDWGTNVGYDNDMLEWSEYKRMADEYAYGDGLGMVGQAQSCTNMAQCFFIQSKMCFTSQMSSDRGQDDVASGEIYYGAYGGVDGQCDQG
ncbi:hypothetical protein DAMA08_048000 [Martiniozyma asiatica (nom. inval.)]|nr:hypothetical protein DAMA08_048000 [Martiniozyma asiatica]